MDYGLGRSWSSKTLESSLDIGGFGYPAMAVVNLKKKKFSLLKGSFSDSGIQEFLRDISYGRGQSVSLKGEELPIIVDSQPWDGKDGILPQEPEEFEDKLQSKDIENLEDKINSKEDVNLNQESKNEEPAFIIRLENLTEEPNSKETVSVDTGQANLEVPRVSDTGQVDAEVPGDSVDNGQINLVELGVPDTSQVDLGVPGDPAIGEVNLGVPDLETPEKSEFNEPIPDIKLPISIKSKDEL